MQKVVTFGEIMLRLSPPGNQRFVQAESLEVTYGGGEANVALSLAQLGIPAYHVTCFPDNDFGYAASSYLRKYGVSTDYIVYKGKRLGTYFIEKGSSIRASKVVYDREYSAFAQLTPESFNWREILKGASWFHWTGITPAISQSAADACLEAIKTANELGITVSGDITFRRNLWQYGKSVQEIMPGLVAGSNVVICGENEADEIFGIKSQGHNAESFQLISKQLLQKFPNLKKVISTKRETISASHNKLSGLLFNGDRLLQTIEYDIDTIVDRIGGGDAFMGGFVYGALKNFDDQKTLDFATAASVLKHTIPGDVNLSTVKEIEQVMQGDSVGRLVR